MIATVNTLNTEVIVVATVCFSGCIHVSHRRQSLTIELICHCVHIMAIACKEHELLHCQMGLMDSS